MDIKEKQNRKVIITKDVLCDCCGESCKVNESVVNNEVREDDGEMMYSFEYMELSANWGYFSSKDLSKWTAKVCEKCVDEKFGFIKFEKTRYNPFQG